MIQKQKDIDLVMTQLTRIKLKIEKTTTMKSKEVSNLCYATIFKNVTVLPQV